MKMGNVTENVVEIHRKSHRNFEKNQVAKIRMF